MAHSALEILDASIDARVTEIRGERPGWPCGRGCDACCRNLHEPMNLTRPEWDRVERGLSRLPPEVRDVVEHRVQEAGRICPFLNRERGECLIYASRPIACRTYGFYLQRGAGLWCGDVEAFVTGEGTEGVVLGNQAVVERELGGQRIPMGEWARERRRSSR